MAKTYTITKRGRKKLRDTILSKSKGTYRIGTSDVDVSIGHLVEETEDKLVFGICTHARHGKWELMEIPRHQLRTFRKLDSRNVFEDQTNSFSQ